MKILYSLFFLFLLWTSGFCQLPKMQDAPDIQTVSVKIEDYHLYNDLQNHSVLLVFHQGFHSNYCNLFIKSLSDSMIFFQSNNVKIIVVTPDNPRNIEKIIHKFNLHQDIKFLHDYDCSIMKSYEVSIKISPTKENFYRISGFANNKENFILPKPSCFLIDKNKKIVFVAASMKPKRRPSVKTIQEQILKPNV